MSAFFFSKKVKFQDGLHQNKLIYILLKVSTIWMIFNGKDAAIKFLKRTIFDELQCDRPMKNNENVTSMIILPHPKWTWSIYKKRKVK